MDIATEEEEDVFVRFSYMLAKSSSMSSSSWLRVVRSGRALPNVLSINYKLNYWRMWDGNIGKWINFNTYRTDDSFHPLPPPPGEMISHPGRRKRIVGRSVGGWRLVRCYVGRSFSPSLANVCRCYLSFHPRTSLRCHRMDIIIYNSSVPNEGDRNSSPAGPRGQESTTSFSEPQLEMHCQTRIRINIYVYVCWVVYLAVLFCDNNVWNEEVFDGHKIHYLPSLLRQWCEESISNR